MLLGGIGVFVQMELDQKEHDILKMEIWELHKQHLHQFFSFISYTLYNRHVLLCNENEKAFLKE